jgi:hypothetical protein
MGKIVAPVAATLTQLKISAADVHHAGVVTIICQQFLTETKEVRMRQTIVLENDSFLHLLEKPAHGGTDRVAAALVGIEKTGLDLTRPVDAVHNVLADGGAFFRLPGTVGAGAVGGYKQAWRPGIPNLGKYPFRGLNPVEDHE